MKVVTPTVLGDGSTYDLYSYIWKAGKLHVLNMSKFLEALSKGELVNEYARVVEERKPLEPFLHQSRIDPIAFSLYSMKIHETSDVPTGKGPQITKTIRGKDHLPYMPGSGIKGAIRTAFLYYHAMARKKEILEELRRTKDMRKAARYIERRLLRGSKDDPRFDLFRFIVIRDSEPLAHEDVGIYQIKLMASAKPISYVEALNEGTSAVMEIIIEEERVLLENLGLGRYKDALTLDSLLEALYVFSKDQLNHEESYYRQRREHALAKRIESLATLNTPKSPLAHLGYGQSFLSTTISLLAKNSDKEIYARIARATWGKKRGDEFPRTRKLARIGVDEYAPLGWVRVEA